MTASQQNTPEEEIAGVDVSQRTGFSIIWVIPLVALIIGSWMTVKTYMDQGPLVAIEFKNAAGVIAKKTKVRMRDVEIGVVEQVLLSDDMERVIVKARLTNESEKMLVEGTRFWVEVPRVTATEVKGLQTILSGVFIGIDPAESGQEKRKFIGLDKPPFLANEDGGRFFNLHADSRGSVNEGSPVVYRGIDVGQVVSYEMSGDGSGVDIRIYIKAPYYGHINLNTRFWEISGINLKLSAEGFEVNTESIVSILIGGISFGLPDYLDQAEIAQENKKFNLYSGKDQAFERSYETREMVLYFDGSVRGLEIGAPVEFRGIKVGKVTDIRLQFDQQDFAIRIPVYIQIHTDRFEMIGEMDKSTLLSSQGSGAENMQRLVGNGMRAQLQSGSLLTGARLVTLNMYPDAPKAEITIEGNRIVMPTIPASFDELTGGITTIINKISAMPLEQIGADLAGTVKRAKELLEKEELEQISTDLAGTVKRARELLENKEIEEAIHSLNSALKETEVFTKNISTTVTPQLNATLRELKSAARSIKAMADYLERHPEALIQGKAGGR